MKTLVTGGAGFIGSHVADRLIGLGHDVSIIDNLWTGHRHNVNPSATFYEADIRSRELDEIMRIEEPECVIHHAAQMNVRRSIDDPILDADVNILGSLKLIECCKKHHVRKIIYISTGGAVYGEPCSLPTDETHPINPLSQYGVSKHTVEHYLEVYRISYGLNYTILRYPNVYGPRQDPCGEAGVVAIFARRMLRGEEVIINGSGQQERDFVYVSDIVTANVLSMEKGDGEILNLGSGKGTSVNEIFDQLSGITAYKRKPVYAPPLIGEVFKATLNAGKALQLLGWRPSIGLEAGLERTVEFLRGSQQ